MYAQIENPLLAAMTPPADITDAAIAPQTVTARPLFYTGDKADGSADPLLLESMTRWSAWKDIMLVPLYTFLLTILLGTPFGILLGCMKGGAREDSNAMFLVVFSAGTLSLLAVVMQRLRKRGQTMESVGLGVPPLGRNLLLGIGITFALLALDYWGVRLVHYLAPGSLEHDSDETGDLIAAMSLFGLAPFAFLVAVSEELIFRGFLMTRLRRVMGSWTLAVVVSAVLFVACHDVPPGAIPFIAIPSIVWSVMTIWRKSLVPAITSHFLLDLMLFFAASQFA